MNKWQRRAQPAEDVKGRAKQPNHMYSYCRVIHCGQAAKIVHRMASGTHKHWERERPHPLHHGLPPIKEIKEKYWYPMRHIGEDLEGAVELLVDHHLDAVSEFKMERDRQGAYTSSPYPSGLAPLFLLAGPVF